MSLPNGPWPGFLTELLGPSERIASGPDIAGPRSATALPSSLHPAGGFRGVSQLGIKTKGFVFWARGQHRDPQSTLGSLEAKSLPT